MAKNSIGHHDSDYINKIRREAHLTMTLSKIFMPVPHWYTHLHTHTCEQNTEYNKKYIQHTSIQKNTHT